MSRTFVFLYVFVLPFVLVEDSSSNFAHCFMAFVLTFGFVGLELCAIGLDDPFGDDEVSHIFVLLVFVVNAHSCSLNNLSLFFGHDRMILIIAPWP